MSSFVLFYGYDRSLNNVALLLLWVLRFPPNPHTNKIVYIYVAHTLLLFIAELVNLLRSPGIDSHPGGPVQQPYLMYWPARLQCI
jgi:hypothetical protein